jgi:hypothetical protein
MKVDINFNDTNLQVLSQNCENLLIPTGNDYLKMSFSLDNKNNVSKIINNHLSKIISSIIITIQDEGDNKNKSSIYTFNNVRIVPVAMDASNPHKILYNVEFIYGSKNYTNPL